MLYSAAQMRALMGITGQSCAPGNTSIDLTLFASELPTYGDGTLFLQYARPEVRGSGVDYAPRLDRATMPAAHMHAPAGDYGYVVVQYTTPMSLAGGVNSCCN